MLVCLYVISMSSAGGPQSVKGKCPALPDQGPHCRDGHRRDGYLEAQSVRPCTGWAAGGRGINPGLLLGWVWKKGRPG